MDCVDLLSNTALDGANIDNFQEIRSSIKNKGEGEKVFHKEQTEQAEHRHGAISYCVYNTGPNSSIEIKSEFSGKNGEIISK